MSATKSPRALRLLPAAFCAAAMPYSVIAAIRGPDGGPPPAAVALVAAGGAASVLGIAYLATRVLEKVVANEGHRARSAARLKMVIWCLTMTLASVLNFRVISAAQAHFMAAAVWGIAASACSAAVIFSGPSSGP